MVKSKDRNGSPGSFPGLRAFTWSGFSGAERLCLFALLIIVLDNAIPALLILVGRVTSSQWLLQENGIYESAGALACFVGSVILLVTYVKYPLPNNFGLFTTRRNVFLLLLALFLFFLAGEEISWGQKLLGFQTPDFVSVINFQNELNIHNLTIIQESNNALASNGCRLLLAYLMLLPIGLAAFPAIEKLISPLRPPLPSIRISLLTAATYFLNVVLMGHGVIGSVTHDSLDEAFETNLEIVLCLLAVECYYRAKKGLSRPG